MKKIAEAPTVFGPNMWKNKPFCLNPEHNPPQHISLSPGIYEHVCPGCGKKQIITIYGVQ